MTAPRCTDRLFALGLVTPLVLVSMASGQSIAQLWTNNCIACHGAQAQGGSAPSLLDDQHRDSEAWPGKGKQTNRDLFDAIKKGHEPQGMPSFGAVLKDAEIWGLVNNLRELQNASRRKNEGDPKADDKGVFTSAHHKFTIEPVVTKGISVPWAVDFLPSTDAAKVGTMLITERAGKLRTFSAAADGGKGKLSAPIENIPKVYTNGQGGLMEVTVHPDYAKNSLVYLSYSDADESGKKGMTKIICGKIKDGGWTEQKTIFEAPPETYVPNSGLHFGSRIVFTEPSKDDKAGRRYVYFCIGERGRGDDAQELTRPNGKVHRVWEDGEIPSDNPFVAQDNAIKSIWSYGHRNPQGLVIDLNGNLWDTEHGPRGGDELNLIAKGQNYGWPKVSFGINYNGAALGVPWPEFAGKEVEDLNINMPKLVWLPSVAVCGLDVARPGPAGEAFPRWKGDLFAGGLAGQSVDRLRVTADGTVTEREEIIHGLGRVRDVATAPDGSLYIVLNDPDSVVRLVPAK